MQSKPQNTRLTDMTQGPPRAILLRFGLPLIASGVLQQVYSLADGVILGRFGGVESLAILGTSGWVLWFQTSVIMNFAQAASLLLARWFGAKETEKLKSTAGNAQLLAAVLCLIMTVGLELLARPLLVWQATPPEVLEGAVIYLRISFGGTIFLFLFNFYGAMLRAVGNSRGPMVAICVASVLNIGLDIWFVAGLGWGPAGAAIATVIAQALSGLYCWWQVRRLSVFRLQKHHWRPNLGILKEILRLSLPMVLQSLFIMLGGIYVQMCINRYGTLFAAGISGADRIFGMLETTAIALSQAAASFVSQNYGAGQFGRIRKGMGSAVRLSLLFAAVFNAALLLCGKPLLALFVGEAAMPYAWGYSVAAGIALLVMFPMYVVRQGIQALGNAVVPLVAAVLQLAARFLTATFLPLAMGPSGLYWPNAVACFATLVIISAVFPRQLRLNEARMSLPKNE